MDPTQRFSDRADNYRRYRPGYPGAVIDLLRGTAKLVAGAPVADIGSGTGILTRLLLAAGCEVFAVEPNSPMRQAGEADLSTQANFHSVDATAEATTLPDASMAAITCAQAFHWFDSEKARVEFRRILRPDGWVFLIWNDRRYNSDFDRAFDAILNTLGRAYKGVRDREGEKGLRRFFRAGTFAEATFANPQELDWPGLRGRFLSSSYVPGVQDPRHAGLLAQLEDAYLRHQHEGKVVLSQETHVFYGQL